MTEKSKKIILGVMGGVWILICGEVSLRVVSAITPVYNIEMLKYAKALKIKSSRPRISHEHRPNSSAHLMGTEISLNSLGHRSNELQNPKGKDEKRIFILGDSIALGWGVSKEYVFAEGLEKRLNEEKGTQEGLHYRSINAGIGNYNAFYKVELFKAQMKAVDPDLVVLQYYVNDAQDNPMGTNYWIHKHSLLAASLHYYFVSTFSQATSSLAEYYAEMYVDGSAGWANARASLEELKAICDEEKIPLIVLLIPDLHELSNDSPVALVYKKIQKMFDEMNVPMVNTFSAIQSRFLGNPSDAWVSHDDPHPNKEVHQIIADALFNFINKQKL